MAFRLARFPRFTQMAGVRYLVSRAGGTRFPTLLYPSPELYPGPDIYPRG